MTHYIVITSITYYWIATFESWQGSYFIVCHGFFMGSLKPENTLHKVKLINWKFMPANFGQKHEMKIIWLKCFEAINSNRPIFKMVDKETKKNKKEYHSTRKSLWIFIGQDPLNQPIRAFVVKVACSMTSETSTRGVFHWWSEEGISGSMSGSATETSLLR